VVQENSETEAADQSAEIEKEEAQLSNVIKRDAISFTTPKTVKLGGLTGSQKLSVLTDCGASHNFISTAVVHIANFKSSPPLANLDVGLGIQRLASLGPMEVNWQTQIMKFEWQRE